MSIAYNTSIVRNGLVLHLDAANPKSYPGTGTVWADLVTRETGTILSGVNYSTNPSKFDTNATAATDLRHLTTPNIFFIDTSPYSMEFWIKLRPSASSTYHSLTGQGATSPWLSVFCNDTTGGSWALRYRQSGGTYIGSTTITDWNIQSNWASICISVSPSRAVSFYLNGDLRQVLTPTTTLFTVNRVAGGYSSGGSYYPLQGSIASVKMYNQTLSAAEVQQNFEALRGRYGV